MTKNYRCIKCELVWDEENITYSQICKVCEEGVANNNERRRLWNTFCGYCKELFYIRYPEPNHSGVTIPSDDEGKAKMIQEAKRKLGIGLKHKREWKEDMEEKNETSSQLYKEYVADIAQMEQLVPLIVNLEQRYCKK